jgi:hypothetical protein
MIHRTSGYKIKSEKDTEYNDPQNQIPIKIKVMFRIDYWALNLPEKKYFHERCFEIYKKDKYEITADDAGNSDQ